MKIIFPVPFFALNTSGVGKLKSIQHLCFPAYDHKVVLNKPWPDLIIKLQDIEYYLNRVVCHAPSYLDFTSLLCQSFDVGQFKPMSIVVWIV